jgi:chromosome segregation protein
MRLERLELSGFKSFPERAELRFDKGVTAIVGPNGCGKSNLVDAITWVLGEQSARSLRGERMEDVIFNGSDGRKPTAAAEVKVKLSGVASSVPARLRRSRRGSNGHGEGDAAGDAPTSAGAAAPELGDAAASGNGHGDPLDLDETPPIVRDVEVARRLYRSGESEYLIDGEVVRLRDVYDLLMDAGIGVRGYAVIEQGRIGQILSARPSERRQLIEEAAGITKYKTRRRAAELKLEAAQQNLARVEDIIAEVERQRGALKRQAAKARRYRRLREALGRWEKVVFARRYRALAEAHAAARARLEAAEARAAAAAAAVADAEARAEAARLALAEAEARAARTREAAHAAELELGRREQQLAFDREQVAGLERAAADLDEELRAIEARRGPVEVELEAKRAALAEVEAERVRAAAGLAELDASQQAAERALEGLESDVEAARSEVFSALNAATALRHAVEHAAAARERVVETIARLEAESRDLGVEAARVAAEAADARAALAAARAALETAREAAAAREAERGAARARREALAATCRALEQDLAAARARLASLEELDQARAAYGEAARLVLTEPGVEHLGALADYLEVDARYARAVEACLGERLEYIVVRRRADALAALETVRARQAGRCGFVVLDAAPPAPPAREAPEGVVPLASVVRVNGPFQAAIAAALGEAWIADSLEAAVRQAGAVGGPVATLTGEVCRGPHLLEGGGGERRGILTLRGEIRTLGARITALADELTSATADLAALEATIAALDEAIAAGHAEHHAHEKAVVGYELRLARAEDEAERLARKRELVELERARAEEERQALDARQAEATTAIARLEAEQREADARLLAAQRELMAAREALAAQGARRAEAKAALAALVERAAGLAAEVRRLEDAAGELEARLGARTAERAKVASQRAALVDAIARLERQLDQDRRAFDALRAELGACDETCARLRVEVDEADRVAREARRALEAARAEVGQLDLARATVDADLAHLAEACREATQTSLEAVAAEVARWDETGALEPAGAAETETEGADSEDEAVPSQGLAAADRPAADLETTPEAMVAALRAKIDRLGPVNMMAVEQFDELEARHAFLTAQRQDLVDAIAATGDAIKRIDRTSRERFQEAFTAINQYFQETFATLFGGGRAGLVLLDEGDALESGIDIIAQPPGKRLQNVQLLSGGEKALVAMALMFALFQYRPSPFCLLDEIDAPLDDANIGRFVEMLQRLQEKTQFILITHNRKTMEIADRLYGVTMEEPGVSKLISVQLN